MTLIGRLVRASTQAHLLALPRPRVGFPAPVGADGQRAGALDAGAGRDRRRDRPPVVGQRRPRGRLAADRGREVVDLSPIGLREGAPAIEREAGGVGAGQHVQLAVAERRQLQARRALGADHLAADVHSGRRGAADQARRGGAPSVGDGDVGVVGTGVGIDGRVAECERGHRVLAEQPSGGVEVVHADVHDEAAAEAVSLIGREVLATDRVDREGLADRAAGERGGERLKPRVVTAVVGDADDQFAAPRGGLLDHAVLGKRHRAGLLEQQVLAGAQYVDGPDVVVAGPRRQQHRLDAVVGQQVLDLEHPRRRRPGLDLAHRRLRRGDAARTRNRHHFDVP